MNSTDAIAGLMLGIFLVIVAIKGNAKSLIQLGVRDISFLRWGIAIAILIFIRNAIPYKKPIDLLIAAAFFGLALETLPTLKTSVTGFWNDLKGK